MSFDAGSVSARLELDRSDFTAGLDAAKADADKFTSKPIQAKITADGTQAKATLDDLTARADKLSGKAGTIKVTADATQANTEMDKTSAKADALGKKDPTVTVKADTTAANADLDKTAAKADALGRKTETITVRVDTSTRSLDDASKKVDDLSSKLTKLSDKLKDKSGPAWLGPAILALPVATSLIGAATGAATGLGGAFAAAGIAAAGFDAVAKPVLTNAYTAATAATAAQGAYTAAVTQTTGTYQIAMAAAKTRAQQRAAYAAEQKGFAKDRLAETAAQTKAYAGMSTQQIALSKQLGGIATAWKNVQTAQAPVIAGALQPWLQTVTPLLHDLSTVIAGVAPVIKDLGVKMADVVNSPEFKSFADFITGTGSTALNSIGSTIIDLIDSFIILAPKFTPLIDQASAGIANFGAKVLAWAQSKQASDDITSFLKWFSTNGPGAWTLIKNLGDALKALSPGLTSGGVLEMHILSDFFAFIAKLPPSVAKPITEVVGALLLASKLGVLKLGVKIVSAGGKLLDLLTGTAKSSTIEIASAGMTSAADTMLLASQNMLKAAGMEDTAGLGGKGSGTAEADAVGAGIGGKLLGAGIITAIALAITETVVKPVLQSKSSGQQNDSTKRGNWWDNPGGANPTDKNTKGQGISTWAGLGTGIKDLTGFGQSTPKVTAPTPSGKAPAQLGLTSPNVGEPNWTKWWQDFDRDVVHKVTDWVTKSLPDAFTRSIPGWFTNVWSDFNRDVVQKIVNWVTQSLPGFFTSTVPHWFDSAVTWFTSKVIDPVKNFVTATVPGFFTTTIPHWFDSAVTWFTSKVINPVKTFVTSTIPGFFTSTIPHWFDIAVTWFTSKVITPVKTFVTATLPGFFTTTIPHWFDIAVTWLTSKVINPVKTFVTSTLPGFFTSTIPRWFDSVGTWFTSKVINPITSFITSLPGKIASGFKSGINTVIGFVDTILGAVKLPTIPKLATGGMVPGGYSREDNQLAWLRSGEGVLQPGAVTALGGPGFIHWANASYGDVPVGSAPPGHFASGGIIPGAISGAVHDVTGAASNVLGDVAGLLKSGFKFAFDHLWSATVTPVLGEVGAAPAGNIVVGVADEVKQHFDDVLTAKDAAAKAAASTGNASTGKFTGSYGAGVKQWTADVLRALSMLGLPASDLGFVLAQMQSESGGNPNAINNWDSNAAAGDPSRGLMQTIMTTFEAYRSSSLPNNIYDPMANIYAALNYAKHGAGFGTAPGQIGSMHGYDEGGWLQPGMTMVRNDTGRPEPVLNPAQWDSLSSAMAGGSGIGDKLDRIANLLAAQPRATASGVGDVLNNTGRMASFRNRYPRNN